MIILIAVLCVACLFQTVGLVLLYLYTRYIGEQHNKLGHAFVAYGEGTTYVLTNLLAGSANATAIPKIQIVSAQPKGAQ